MTRLSRLDVNTAVVSKQLSPRPWGVAQPECLAIAFRRRRRHSGAVPSVQVKGVPADVHRTLRRRAAAAGQSLQEYLLERVTEQAQTPTLDEVLDRAGGRSGGSVPFKDAVTVLRVDRDRR